jgi:hypothetical protein
MPDHADRGGADRGGADRTPPLDRSGSGDEENDDVSEAERRLMTEREIDAQLWQPTTRAQMATFLGRAAVEGFRKRRTFDEVERFFFLVGYTRSGSTLVGTMLNSHPDMVIAHEANAFRYVRPGITRNQLFAILLTRDRQFSEVGREWHGFDYRIDAGSQGHYRQLRVIGDKHAGRTSRKLHRYPDLLDRLRHLVRVPIRALHVTRNPYDNIASIARNVNQPLSDAIEVYRQVGTFVDEVATRLAPDELLAVRYEDFIVEPETALRRVCAFIGVEASADYLASCAALANPATRPARTHFDWTAEQRREVDTIIESRPVLHGYSFESDTAR